jgi:hypothetical protein
MSKHRQTARLGTMKRRQDPKQRGLAGTVRPDERHQLPFGNVDVDAGERCTVPVALSEPASDDQRDTTSMSTKAK